MYDNLVKRLRDAACLADKGLVITPHLCLEAADALEKLSLSLIEVISIAFPEIICQQLNTEPCEDYAGEDSTDAMAFAYSEKKKGKWDKDSNMAFYWKCSECGAYLFWRHEDFIVNGNPNYCPNCGADMRGQNNG